MGELPLEIFECLVAGMCWEPHLVATTSSFCDSLSGLHFTELLVDILLQALTNQIISDIRSRAHVLYYLFVNVHSILKYLNVLSEKISYLVRFLVNTDHFGS